MSAEPEGAAYSPALGQEQADALLQTSVGEDLRDVYMDLSSNQPKTEETRAQFRQNLQESFSLKLTDVVERIWQLPPVVVHRSNAEYISLLDEARELFKMGYFYSCVAMCGIVGEKLIKDLLRKSILVLKDGASTPPTDEAFDQFARVDANNILNFLKEAKLISDDTKMAAVRLAKLRNDYAHARGKNAQRDALGAIANLHLVIGGTVSLLTEEIKIDRAASAHYPLVEDG
jgi:hypothetical protein